MAYSAAQDIFADLDNRYEAALAVMDRVYEMLSRDKRIKHPYMSTVPRDKPGSFVTTLISPLLNKKRQEIGNVRVFVRVPKTGYHDAWVKIEWTRKAFGFWYTNEVVVYDVVGNPEKAKYGKLRSALKPVGWTADGTVPMKSMNRTYRKVQKKRAVESAARAGLRRR